MQERMKDAVSEFKDFNKFCRLENAVSGTTEVIQRYFSSSRVFAQAIKDWLPGHTSEFCPMQIQLRITIEDVMSVDSPAFMPPTTENAQNGKGYPSFDVDI